MSIPKFSNKHLPLSLCLSLTMWVSLCASLSHSLILTSSPSVPQARRRVCVGHRSARPELGVGSLHGQLSPSPGALRSSQSSLSYQPRGFLSPFLRLLSAHRGAFLIWTQTQLWPPRTQPAQLPRLAAVHHSHQRLCLCPGLCCCLLCECSSWYPHIRRHTTLQ